MNIDGMSEKTLEKFIDMGWLNTYSDIFRLKDFADKIVCLDGFAEKSVTKMLDSIENAKNTTLVRLFVALNIDGIGKQTANDLSAFFADNPENVLKMKTSEIRDKLIHVEGFGETLVDSICKWHDSDEDMSEFRNLLSYITIESTPDQNSDVLNGLKFVITGSLETYRNRNDLISDIENNGGKVQSSVSKETSYLINNDVNSTSGKNKKAKELGVSIISEKDFVCLLNGDQPQKSVKKKGLF
jgi:DNA ligase (NAD+)